MSWQLPPLEKACSIAEINIDEYLPLEFIQPLSNAKKVLGEMEALLISCFNPELNKKHENVGSMSQMRVHIQNFSGISDFLNDYEI